ncbi:hypothetical protein LWI28_003951 [Acer negundo]|uniref:Uncharacterized protein n=1 Tax=Acer negundo TaxID=4023 RepID=A0AAD5NPJ8_ACENE|nr:hypothetical protein LWI28_003951 [Acer negundo]
MLANSPPVKKEGILFEASGEQQNRGTLRSTCWLSRTGAGQSKPVKAGGGARSGSGRAESTPSWASYGDTGADRGGTETDDSDVVATAVGDA